MSDESGRGSGQTTKVKFYPLNDQVLVKMDTKMKSILERGVNDRPTVLPSGVVIAVGKGVFVPNVGFIEPQVKAGDHVAVSMAGEWAALPISEVDGDVFMCVSETLLLGRLDGATETSPWFKSQDKAEALAGAAVRLAKRGV